MPWMPPAAGEATASGGKSGHGAGKALLGMIPDLFDAKRNADADAERRGQARPDFPSVVKQHISNGYLKPNAVAEKLVALRFAASSHRHVARVAIFSGMMGWDPHHPKPWDNTKAAACLLLMLWLQPQRVDEAAKATSKVTGVLVEEHVALELRLEDVDEIIKHLLRKRLVSAKGAGVLKEEAATLAVEQQLPPASSSAPASAVDVEALLIRWMGTWGSWEKSEEKQVLSSIINKFGGGSPFKTKS